MGLDGRAARFGLGCAALLACAAAIQDVVFAHDPADTLADRFAREPERARSDEPALGAKQSLETAPARRAAQRAAEAGAPVSATEEAEMLERARQEAAERKAAEEANAPLDEANGAERLKAELEASKALEERARTLARARAPAAAQPASAGDPGTDAEARLTRQRSEEARRLAEKLRHVRQLHAARRSEQPEAAGRAGEPTHELEGTAPEALREAAHPNRDALPQAPSAVAATGEQLRAGEKHGARRGKYDLTGSGRSWPPSLPEPVVAQRPLESEHAADAVTTPRPFASLRRAPARVTVLLALAPGTYGIRRHHPGTADPVLCALDGCFISAGADTPALFLPGRKALGFANTWGLRAGACRESLHCVFRGVELGELPGYLQPVDLHILHHDRRRGQVIDEDSACRIRVGRLTCEHGIATAEYRLWVVPEHLAAEAGPAALEQALTDGLEGTRAAGLSLER